MKTLYCILVSLLGIVHLTYSQPSSKLIIEHYPKASIIELYQNRYYLNFDFVIDKSGSDTLYLDKIIATYYDNKSQYIGEKFLDNNGSAPSLDVLKNTTFKGVTRATIFNPFHENVYTHISKIKYQFIFLDNLDNEISILDTVSVSNYHQSFNAILPLKDKLLVYDGHDYLSHHRRFDLEAGFIKKVGFKGNFMRYAFDFVVLDSLGNRFKNKGKDNSDWFAFSKPVNAVTDGEIVALRDSLADDKSFNMQNISINPFELFGNYVVIKHSENVFSVYGHLKQNSLKGLKLSAKVKQNQKIGEIGLSGSTFFPHLHFEMQNSIDFNAEGLPSYFSKFIIFQGNQKLKIIDGTINTGDIVQTTTK
jgi:hypothetical protein